MSRFAVFAALLALLCAFGVARAQGVGGPTRSVSDEVLIKLRPGVPAVDRDALPGRFGGRSVRVFSHVGWMQVKLPAGLAVSEAMARARGFAEVATVEPNYEVQASVIPNDSRYGSLWGMTKIQAPAAWDSTTGSGTVVAAVIDTGVNYNHQDLAANMWRNPGEVGGNNVDDDRNGYVDDVYGINAITNNGNPLDDAGHGTHVAGTIGAVGNNAVGVAGVNWQVKIMALKFLAKSGSGSTADAVECYNYLIGMKKRGVDVRVANNSWGGSGYSQALKDAVDIAGTNGVLTTAAAGNGNSSGVGQNIDAVAQYPAGFASASVLAVAASDQNDKITAFSNYSATKVGLAAPGIGILSTYYSSNSAYASMSGTSMATPHVSGAAALLAAKNGALTVAALKSTLLATVDKLPQWTGKVSSGGRLNLAAAIAAAGGTTPPPPPPPAATYQPDLMIRANNGASFLGDNVYNSTMQGVTLAGTLNAAAIFQTQVQNDGNTADAFTLTGPGSNSGWTVRYFNAAAGGLDVTAQVTGSGYRTATVNAGSATPLRIEVTPVAGAAGTREVLLTAKSVANTAKSDIVKAIVSAPVTANPLTNVTLIGSPASPVAANTPVTLIAQAIGGTAEYMFTVRRVSWWGSSTSTLQAYSQSNSLVWRPTTAGTYTLTVYARRAGSTVSYDVYKMISYTVQ